MSHKEPEGWKRLQALAKRERDPSRFVEIINQMNRILDEHERRDGWRDLFDAAPDLSSEALDS